MTKQLSWRLSILAAVLAGGALFWPLPGWATPIGVSIALTNVLFDYQPVARNLSAEAAPIGGLPARPLPAFLNGHYTDTAVGDFAVTVNLPPLDQQNLWLVSADLSINGEPAFGGKEVFGPFSVTDVKEAITELLGQLNPKLPPIVEKIGDALLMNPEGEAPALFDWAYNRDPADDMTGTFALGSVLDSQRILGFSLLPGEFTFDLSLSASVVDAPEPDPLLILAPALLGLVALRWRTAHRVENVAATGPLRVIKQDNAALCNRQGAEPKARFALRRWRQVVTPI
jgi:hypothetical protein